MKKHFAVTALLVTVAMLTGCMPTSGIPTAQHPSTAAGTTAGSSAAATQETTPLPSPAEQLLQRMTMEEMVSQLFLVALEEGQDMADFLQTYPVGGVILFAKDIRTPEQLLGLTGSLQAAARIPLLLSVDEEGGRVARIAGNKNFSVPTFESAQAVGSTGDPAQARQMGAAIGKYLHQYGFQLDFAPVADVNSNPQNPVIGDRAFGSDPWLVAKMVAAAIDGFHAEKVLTCIKHFPGHGDTTGDTHAGFVSVDKTWNALLEEELIPFRANLDRTDLIMMAHVTAPQVTTDGLPSSLSYEMITEKLRGELGYHGVVVTDALNMGAIVNEYGADQAAVLAFLAGADILLMPADFLLARQSVLNAVQDGRISRQRLEESVLRILQLKERCGLLTA